MDEHTRDPRLPGAAQLRVIALALLAGPVLAGGVVAYLRASATFGGDFDLPYVDLLAAGIGVLLCAAAFPVRRRLFGGGEVRDPVQRIMKYAAGVMVFCALLEAAMLFNLMAALLVPTPWVNVGVFALAFALAATSLPSDEQRDNVGLGPTAGLRPTAGLGRTGGQRR